VTAAILTIPNFIASSGGDVRADEPEKVRRDDILRIIGALGGIIAAVLAIVVIRKVATRQEEALRAQQAAVGASPPAS
jgi:beta-lactamase regulating signal transducer with metallopeptidase domain